MEKVEVHVKYQISESIENVFDAIVNAKKLTKFFTSNASGNLSEGAKIIWTFGDAGVSSEVEVLKIIENSEIRFDWSSNGKQYGRVTIKLFSIDENHSTIDITESAFEFTKEGVQTALGQTQGWTDFACSLKAFLYTGINLRK
ncbi:MAG: SRPBCC domain-containing protein [Bacteroidetes bacterium]|nr:SRPBCC domain-containing protein [Bacteroidota bacterium]MBP7400636.1 SRPBCC domain-containing protein [Chitinophagales bacterium]MBK7110743.1 SRPBCC domain-containing protein [Bacteroidota bacterium]MBK8488040.1 SRPBCC domain-containing protein [Bacteroidota bacterium]MBK8682204.1 SRPBCC domain-containing protein [Bacteroidota bacterium]